MKFNVKGMSCAACSARVERAVTAVPGVASCSVSLLTNSMEVEGTADEKTIEKAVRDAGYRAFVSDSKESDFPEDTETPKLRLRLVSSVIFLIILMYFSMGHMMFNLPLPPFLNGNHAAMGLVQLLLTVIIMVINRNFFVSGFTALFRRAPNMDSLVAMGSSAAFLWSVYVLFAMTAAQTAGDMTAVMKYMDEFYFESAAMILTLITVGKTLEAKSKGKTTDALKGLMDLAPKTAIVIKDGKEVTIPAEQLKKGDIFAVRPGDSIPVDGVVTEGHTAVNEAALTGESVPAEKSAGDRVFAATVNQSGYIRCEATGVGAETTLSQIIKMVSDAAASKAPIAKAADKISAVFVPAVITIAVITFVVWLILGKGAGFALARGISVLVISCPCALGLATPVAIMVGSGVGAKKGILFKTAAALENTGRIKTAVLDKTGTITRGEPEVTDIVPAEGFTESELMDIAAAAEAKSEHPLARAVVKKAEEKNISPLEASDFSALPGNGVTAFVSGERIYGGSAAFINEKTPLADGVKNTVEKLSEQGKTPLLFMRGEKLAGIIAVADAIKPESPKAIAQLKEMGINVVMLTGDNERTAKAIGAKTGVDEVIAGVLPDGKENVIKELASRGKVAMVGDGINDAPALTRADIGIAIGAGADIAIDAADAVLMKSKLTDVPAAIRLSRSVLRNIHENLFWAFIYNVIGIPLAAGCFAHFGLTLNPMFAAAAMSLSSVCVVTNALRLNLVRQRRVEPHAV